jgi:hypothetical protein
LVSGTQLGYSPVHVQAGLDYIDAHAYWNHPHFPGKPWDSKNWTVHNVALVNSPDGTLASLAGRRVAGMPFTVSEYNHPEPNQYAAEGFPMIAAFGAFQGWDGIFTFTYSHDTDFEPRKITGYFDVKGDTPRLVHMPACAAMFLRGDVAPATPTFVWPLSAEAERKKLYETLSAWKLTAADFGFMPPIFGPQVYMDCGIAADIGKGKPLGARNITTLFERMEPGRKIDYGLCYLIWGYGGIAEGKGYFGVDSPRTKLFTGVPVGHTLIRNRDGHTFYFGEQCQQPEVTLRIGATQLNWATVSMVCIDGEGFDKPGRILIAATGLCQNEGAKLEHLKGDNVTLGNQWGSEPVMCEGIPAEITLPVDGGRVQFYPLDESGNRRQAAPVESHNDGSKQGGRAHLKLDPKYKTLWYEAVIR